MHTSEKRLPTFQFLDLPVVDVIEKNLEQLFFMIDEPELRRTKILKIPGPVSAWFVSFESLCTYKD